MKKTHSLQLSSSDRGSHARQVEALEEILTQRPEAVVIRLFGDGGTPPDLALAYCCIMEEAMDRGTQLILCAYTRLIAADVCIWLVSPWRFLMRGSSIVVPAVLRPPTLSAPLLTEASPEEVLEAIAYRAVLARIEEHCDLTPLLGTPLDAKACSALGLSTGTLDARITQAMRTPAAQIGPSGP
jgi:hypothetical protein